MAGLKWTKQEDEFILSNYKNFTVDELAEKLNRTFLATDARMRSLNIKRAKKKTPNIWTDEQILTLKKNYKELSRKKLAELIGQSENNVRTKLLELNLVNSKKRKSYKVKESKRFYDWTDERIQYLKDNFKDAPMKIMMEYLNCSGHTIIRKAKQIGLSSRRRQTFLEKMVEDILKKIGVQFRKEVYIKQMNFRCDFVIDDIVIEVQGDYWHANPKIFNFNQLDSTQLYNVKRDQIKKDSLERLGYKIIYVWEYDLIHNYNDCFNKLCLLNKKTP